MSENLSRSELTQKLENISGLYKKTQAIQQQMDNFEPEDHYVREIQVPEFPGEHFSAEERKTWREKLQHEEDNAVEMAAMAYSKIYAPEKPAEPKVRNRPDDVHDAEKAVKQKRGVLTLVAAFFGICTLLSGGLFSGEALTIIINLAILIGCVGVLISYFKKLKIAKQADEEATKVLVRNYEENKQATEKKYQQDMKDYETACADVALAKENFVKQYAQWREIYLEHLSEEEKIEEKLEEDRQAAVQKIYEEEMIPAQQNLNAANDLVAEGYLPAVDILKDLIRSGRADGLKEAINLYEELVYRERQLQLQREQEAQRRYEEECRRRDEERRYQEEMQFRERQERQRQREEEQRRSDEERRRREETRAREAEERRQQLAEKERIRKEEYKAHMSRIEQENKQRSAGQAQCRACAHVGRCNMSIHNNAPTCTGFTPRR